MGHFNCICAVTRTRNRRRSGTRGRPCLIINQGGVDRLSEVMKPTESVGSLGRGECLYFYGTLSPEDEVELRDDQLGAGELYVRVGLTSGSWEPEVVFVWGRSKAKGLIPLALDLEMGVTISAKAKEQPSFPVRRVFPGTDDTLVRRLLLAVVTYNAPYAGTDDPIWLRVTVGGKRVVEHVITDTPQTDLEIDTANLYEVPVNTPFTRAQLLSDATTGIDLGIQGSDKWVPKRVYLFGLDSTSDQPEQVVPLVRLADPGPLSVDPTEGVAAIRLPLSERGDRST